MHTAPTDSSGEERAWPKLQVKNLFDHELPVLGFRQCALTQLRDSPPIRSIPLDPSALFEFLETVFELVGFDFGSLVEKLDRSGIPVDPSDKSEKVGLALFHDSMVASPSPSGYPESAFQPRPGPAIGVTPQGLGIGNGDTDGLGQQSPLLLFSQGPLGPKSLCDYGLEPSALYLR